ncbi:MAG: translation initiation factor IF-2, partial [Planctomycetota bacterium]
MRDRKSAREKASGGGEKLARRTAPPTRSGRNTARESRAATPKQEWSSPTSPSAEHTRTRWPARASTTSAGSASPGHTGSANATRAALARPLSRSRPKTGTPGCCSPVTVRDLSAAIGVKANDIIRELMINGLVATINQPIPNDMVQMIALEHGWEITVKEQTSVEAELTLAAAAESQENLEPRVPVVTFLGHVDHGKTSLLDRIRQANVAATESGGITQHIGAHHVTTAAGKEITFLDTPGHEAFTAMRARGAHCTDIVVLVVAADDGVMPQTEEAISHARAAEVPIVIALNKVDLPSADPQRVKPQFARHGIDLEEWGGDVPCVEVSAETGQGIDDLLEMILLVAELRELKANPDKAAAGVVLEANLTEGRGAVATVLVREGTLHVGDVVLCGATFGKVRSMLDGRGKSIGSAGPSIPAQISGLNGVPEASDRMLAVGDLQRAREVAQLRGQRARAASLIARSHVTLENLFGKIAEGEAGEVRVILKVDVMGSLEALKEKLDGLSTDEVKIKFIHSGVGAVNESDVLLADASDAIIIGHRVVADGRIRRIAEEKRVDMRFYQVIFQPVDDMRAALSGLLKPEIRESVTGHAEVRQIFKISKLGNVAGCQVTDGTIENTSKIRVSRDGIVILDGGRIESLRRVKDEARQVQAG